MNLISRKRYALERNVQPELPREGTTKITWDNGNIELDRAESELHTRTAQNFKSLAIFQNADEAYHVKVAETLQEACKLLEVGFEYVTDLNGAKLFRKRK
jgi:hypothetical protein